MRSSALIRSRSSVVAHACRWLADCICCAQGGRKGSPLFKKGCKPGPGRPKGVPNALTQILKEAILLAGEDVGNEIADEAKQERKGLVSYLQWAAIKHPPAYLQLLARVMSTQIETSTKHSEPYKTVEELQKGFRSVASRLPSACSRSRDSLIVLAANLNLRVCSLGYLFGILFSSCHEQ